MPVRSRACSIVWRHSHGAGVTATAALSVKERPSPSAALSQVLHPSDVTQVAASALGANTAQRATPSSLHGRWSAGMPPWGACMRYATQHRAQDLQYTRCTRAQATSSVVCCLWFAHGQAPPELPVCRVVAGCPRAHADDVAWLPGTARAHNRRERRRPRCQCGNRQRSGPRSRPLPCLR